MSREIIWITLVNHGYVSYTQNFLRNIRARNIPFILNIYCTDELAYHELKNELGCCCFHADKFLRAPLEIAMTEWKEEEYKRITFAKLDAIHYTLSNTDYHVGYIDTDIVMFHDPEPYFLEAMEQNTDTDVFSQCDERGQECTDPFGCPNMCTGVTVYRNVPKLRHIFDYTEEDIEIYTSDQEYLNALCSNYNVYTMTLPKSVLMNGCYFPEMTETKIEHIPETCCLLHFNYMIGHQKKECMKLQEMWIKEPTVPLKPPF